VNLKWQLVIANSVLISILVKGIYLPSWSTAFELVAVLAFVAGRWFFEPKPALLATKTEIEEMRTAVVKVAEQVKHLTGKVGETRVAMGLKG
jgi:hypothetical protein